MYLAFNIWTLTEHTGQHFQDQVSLEVAATVLSVRLSRVCLPLLARDPSESGRGPFLAPRTITSLCPVQERRTAIMSLQHWMRSHLQAR